MNLVALLLQGLFLLLAFGLRTYLHRRKTGSTGFRAGASRSLAEALGAGGITVAAILSLLGTVLVTSDVEQPIIDVAGLQWFGGTIAAAGLILVLAAQSNMGASWRIGVDQAETTELVTGGLFSLTRNPIFLGMLAFWFGIALMTPNVWSIAAFVIAFVAVEIQVRNVEEPYLRRVHGSVYLAYAGRTGRLVPGLGRLRTPGG